MHRETEPILSQFLYEHNAKNIVKQKTCFKNMENPSCIDLYITNSPKSFQNTTTLDTGLSDYHKMVITVLKTSFQKAKPKEFYYRDYRNLNREDFKIELQNKLNNNVASYELFEKLFLEVLDKHAPFKSRIIR